MLHLEKSNGLLRTDDASWGLLACILLEFSVCSMAEANWEMHKQFGRGGAGGGRIEAIERGKEGKRENLRVEEIGKRLDDGGDHTRRCDRLGVWRRGRLSGSCERQRLSENQLKVGLEGKKIWWDGLEVISTCPAKHM